MWMLAETDAFRGMPGDGATIPAPARPYDPGATYQSAPSRAPSRQGRLLPIHPSTAPVNKAEQYWVERQTRAVAGFGRPPQTADASSRSRKSRGQQLLYSRGSTPSAPLLLPKSKSNFSLSGSSMTGGAALDVPTTRRREARRGPEAQHRLEVQHRLERHHQQRGDGYTSIGCLQARRSHLKPTPRTSTFSLTLTPAPRSAQDVLMCESEALLQAAEKRQPQTTLPASHYATSGEEVLALRCLARERQAHCPRPRPHSRRPRPARHPHLRPRPLRRLRPRQCGVRPCV